MITRKIVRNILIALYIVIMFGYIVFAFIYFKNSGNDNLCNNVQISIKDSSDLRFISESDINKLLKNKDLYPIEKKISEIKLHKLEEAIMKHPVVKKVECFRTSDNSIRIDVYQRKPLFRVISDRYNFYIDDEKEEMPVPKNFAADVPVVTGNIDKDFIKNELFDFIVYVSNDDFWDAQIEQIDVYQKNKVALVPRVGNHIIKLGTLDDYKTKLENIELFYEDGLTNVGWNNYKVINLEYKGQIVCTKNTN